MTTVAFRRMVRLQTTSCAPSKVGAAHHGESGALRARCFASGTRNMEDSRTAAVWVLGGSARVVKWGRVCIGARVDYCKTESAGWVDHRIVTAMCPTPTAFSERPESPSSRLRCFVLVQTLL